MDPGHDAVRETEPEWVRVCDPLATVIDAVMPTDRAAVEAFLEVLFTSSSRREARTVIRLVRLASDPLSDLDTMARNAMRSWVQLRRLTDAKGWNHPGEVLDVPRPTALLNLATAVAEGRYAPTGIRKSKYQAVCERLSAASARENETRRRDVERTLTIRTNAFPNLFPCLDRWLGR